MHSRSSSTPAALTALRTEIRSTANPPTQELTSDHEPPSRQCPWRQQQYHDFLSFLRTALLLDKIAGYRAKETRTATGRLINQAGAHQQRPRQLPIKGGHEIG
jgi:hypothetical protein